MFDELDRERRQIIIRQRQKELQCALLFVSFHRIPLVQVDKTVVKAVMRFIIDRCH